MNIQWNADRYIQDFSYVPAFGGGLFPLLAIQSGERVLDLGCGGGALTNALAEQGAEALGLDNSPSLLRYARAAYPELSFLEADAADFSLPRPVDAVFSNAVLHWIDGDRQPAVLDCVFQALKPGGRFVFELGGMGNNAKIHGALQAAFARRQQSYAMHFFFPSIGQYAALLERACFTVLHMELFDRPTRLEGDGLAGFTRMFISKPFEGTSPVETAEIIAETENSLQSELFYDGAWHADYVRLRGKCVRPS